MADVADSANEAKVLNTVQREFRFGYAFVCLLFLLHFFLHLVVFGSVFVA